MSLSFRIFIILLVIITAGCQTTEGVVLTETPLAIRQTRIAVTSALGEARVISQNGREILTHYHDRKFKFLDVNSKTQERLYTKVSILGARRPYNIEVQVRVEARDPENRKFHDIGLDEQLSLAQARSLQQVLNQSRDSGRSLDEGAPF